MEPRERNDSHVPFTAIAARPGGRAVAGRFRPQFANPSRRYRQSRKQPAFDHRVTFAQVARAHPCPKEECHAHKGLESGPPLSPLRCACPRHPGGSRGFGRWRPGKGRHLSPGGGQVRRNHRCNASGGGAYGARRRNARRLRRMPDGLAVAVWGGSERESPPSPPGPLSHCVGEEEMGDRSNGVSEYRRDPHPRPLPPPRGERGGSRYATAGTSLNALRHVVTPLFQHSHAGRGR